MACKKKTLIANRPNPEPPLQNADHQDTHQTHALATRAPSNMELRQFLADKVTGNLAGVWLLVPELLRLGAWDLVCDWSGQPGRTSRAAAGFATHPRGGPLHHRPAPAPQLEPARL